MVLPLLSQSGEKIHDSPGKDHGVFWCFCLVGAPRDRLDRDLSQKAERIAPKITLFSTESASCSFNSEGYKLHFLLDNL